MKKKIKYTDEPMDFEVVEDFLPPPEKLSLKKKNIKVTLTLSKESVEFFKKIAKKRRYPYQKMIRKVVDYYVSRYKSE